jgi:predicted ArsR family transcriptional regulator
MSSQQSELRARALRARLSSLAEVCAELGVHLPLRKQLAPALGVSERQVQRYMAALIAEGAVEPRTHKNAGRIAA